jgi:threonylcarbamoyladenosine tRNA methylthiotransferase MtaB
MLHILSDKKRRAFYEEHVGKTYPVLWEAESDGNTMFGFTSNYIKVKTTYDPALVNEITMAELTAIDAEMIMDCKNFLFEPVKA